MSDFDGETRAKTRVRLQSGLSACQRRRLFGWGDDIFGGAHLQLAWGGNIDTHFLGYRHFRLCGHVGLTAAPLLVDQTPIATGGVGAVVTRPTVQGRGVARDLLVAIDQAHRNTPQFDHLTLFCLDHLVGYYQSLGYRLIQDQVLIKQPQGMIKCPMNMLYRSLGREDWPLGTVRVNQLPW